MPTKTVRKKAAKDKRQGKSASTQAGEYVKASIDKVKKGKHGARNAKQAIAIGLSQARRDGVKIKDQNGKTNTKKKSSKKVSAKRSKASKAALKREPRSSVSHKALSRQSKASAKKRGPTKRKAAARKAARTRKRTA